jgi:hypothetical protein
LVNDARKPLGLVSTVAAGQRPGVTAPNTLHPNDDKQSEAEVVVQVPVRTGKLRPLPLGVHGG